VRKPSLLTIFLVVFLDLVGFGIVLPLIPFLSREFEASPVEIGLVIASYSFMQFFFAPLWGALSDRVGRRPVILLSLGGSVLSYLMFALAPSLTWVLVSRTFAGICGANISVATAYIADITSIANRAKGMGVIGAAFGLGFIFGPLIGGSLIQFGFHCPGFAACTLSLISLGFAIFALPESLPSEVRSKRPHPGYSLFSGWREALSTTLLIEVMLLALLSNLAFTIWETTFGLFLYDREAFQYDASKFSYLLAYVGLVAAGIQGGLIGKIVKKWGEKKAILMGSFFTVMAFVVICLATHLSSLLVALTLLGMGTSLIRPCCYAVLSKKSGQEDQGKVLGAAQGVSSLTRVAGPLLGGLFYKWGHSIPYWVCAGLMFLCLILASVLTLDSEEKKIPAPST